MLSRQPSPLLHFFRPCGGDQPNTVAKSVSFGQQRPTSTRRIHGKRWTYTRTHALDDLFKTSPPEDNSQHSAIYRKIMKTFDRTSWSFPEDDLVLGDRAARVKICTNCGQIILVLLTGFPTQRCCSLVGSLGLDHSFPPPRKYTHLRRGEGGGRNDILTLSPWMPEYRWFLFYFILGHTRLPWLDTNQLVSSTRMRLLQVWKDFWAQILLILHHYYYYHYYYIFFIHLLFHSCCLYLIKTAWNTDIYKHFFSHLRVLTGQMNWIDRIIWWIRFNIWSSSASGSGWIRISDSTSVFPLEGSSDSHWSRTRTETEFRSF